MPDIIATKGGVNSNSYATTEEADEYLDSIYGADEWQEINEDDKERLLYTASRTIDSLPINIPKADEYQSLNFPVNSKPDGFDEAKEATIIQTFYLSQHHDELKEAVANAIQGLKTESVSNISRALTGHNPLRNYHPDVLNILRNYLELSVSVQRG